MTTTPLTEPERGPELLAPAGGPDAGYAALAYGADAVYLGLQRFSARAEAVNFSLEELDALAAYARSLTPRRRVYVTVNTLVLESELGELVATLAALSDLGVDAVIAQDLGVARILRRHFPRLELHASTQMAVHNLQGVYTLARLGVRRVVAARELTLEELRVLCGQTEVEVECFIHGAVCYSYSGLCLFSSHALGRSANRGRCAYICGGSFSSTAEGRPSRSALPFAMKDLALPNRLAALAEAGVAAFKIEGRKKSPLYVASVTDFYRRAMDGKLGPEKRRAGEADLRTVFSRPWTELYLNSPRQNDCGDPHWVGHRGVPIGSVLAVRGSRRLGTFLRFRTDRALEVHDGLQIDVPGRPRPFGFSIDELRVAGSAGRRFEAPSGSEVEVALPPEHPAVPVGARVYCTSSQAVKRGYRWDKPRQGLYRRRWPIDVRVRVAQEGLDLTARLSSGPPSCPEAETRHRLAGPLEPARDPEAVAAATRAAFERLGDTPFTLGELTLQNDPAWFVAPSQWNRLRRAAAEALESALAEAREAEARSILAVLSQDQNAPDGGLPWSRGSRPIQESGAAEFRRAIGARPVRLGPQTGSAGIGCRRGRATRRPGQSSQTREQTEPFHPGPAAAPRWSIRTDRLDLLDRFEASDWDRAAEVVLCLGSDAPELSARLSALSGNIGSERVRLALPPILRPWDEARVLPLVRRLLAEGWKRWEIANLAGWGYLGLTAGREPGGLDVTADWPLYVMNSAAGRELLDLGLSGFTLSPEDGAENMKTLLRQFGPKAAVIVYQHTPLFVSETCPHANLAAGCPGRGRCGFEALDFVSDFGNRVRAVSRDCRTVVVSQSPLCLSTVVEELAAAGALSFRADFQYGDLTPEAARSTWRRLLAGKPIAQSHAGNYHRGLL